MTRAIALFFAALLCTITVAAVVAEDPAATQPKDTPSTSPADNPATVPTGGAATNPSTHPTTRIYTPAPIDPK